MKVLTSNPFSLLLLSNHTLLNPIRAIMNSFCYPFHIINKPRLQHWFHFTLLPVWEIRLCLDDCSVGFTTEVASFIKWSFNLRSREMASFKWSCKQSNWKNSERTFQRSGFKKENEFLCFAQKTKKLGFLLFLPILMKQMFLLWYPPSKWFLFCLISMLQ